MQNSFSYEMFRTYTSFEKEVQETDSEMAYSLCRKPK